MRRLLALGLGLAVVPAALAAAPAPVPKACPLLTTAQARTALGSDVLFHEAQGNRLWQSCQWHGENVVANRSSERRLMVMVTRLSKPSFRRLRAQTRDARAVRSVGELAYWAENRFTLAAWSNGFQVEVTTANSTTPLASAKQAATAALARLA